MTPGGLDSEPSYSFQPSVFGAGRNFRLTNGALVWEAGRRSGRVMLDRITDIRLSYRPGTLQTHRFLMEIWSPDAPKLMVQSVSWKSVTEQTDQGEAYRAFVVELHRRLSNSKAQFAAGLNPLIYWLSAALMAVVFVAFAGLILRAFQSDAGLTGFLVAAFAVLFVWQGGTILHRNRPHPYRPDALPPLLLPPAKA